MRVKEKKQANRAIAAWCRKLRCASLHITSQEREQLTRQGLDPDKCILIERNDGAGIYVKIDVDGPYFTNIH